MSLKSVLFLKATMSRFLSIFSFPSLICLLRPKLFPISALVWSYWVFRLERFKFSFLLSSFRLESLCLSVEIDDIQDTLLSSLPHQVQLSPVLPYILLVVHNRLLTTLRVIQKDFQLNSCFLCLVSEIFRKGLKSKFLVPQFFLFSIKILNQNSIFNLSSPSINCDQNDGSGNDQ